MQALALYLATCRHQTLVGIARVPIGYLSSDLGMEERRIEGLLKDLQSHGYLEWYEEDEVLWVCEYAKHEFPGNVSKQQTTAISRVLDDFKGSEVVPRFASRYPSLIPADYPIDTLSGENGHGSDRVRVQEQEQEHTQEQEHLGESNDSPPARAREDDQRDGEQEELPKHQRDFQACVNQLKNYTDTKIHGSLLLQWANRIGPEGLEWIYMELNDRGMFEELKEPKELKRYLAGCVKNAEKEYAELEKRVNPAAVRQAS